MNFVVEFSPHAREQARAAATWWTENRPLARMLFASELRTTVALLGRIPGIGTGYPHAHIQGIRRVLMARTALHLYYTTDDAAHRVDIIALWGALRGNGPRF